MNISLQRVRVGLECEDDVRLGRSSCGPRPRLFRSKPVVKGREKASETGHEVPNAPVRHPIGTGPTPQRRAAPTRRRARPSRARARVREVCTLVDPWRTPAILVAWVMVRCGRRGASAWPGIIFEPGDDEPAGASCWAQRLTPERTIERAESMATIFWGVRGRVMRGWREARKEPVPARQWPPARPGGSDRKTNTGVVCPAVPDLRTTGASQETPEYRNSSLWPSFQHSRQGPQRHELAHRCSQLCTRARRRTIGFLSTYLCSPCATRNHW